MTSGFQRVITGLQRRAQRRADNHFLAEVAKGVAEKQPVPTSRPVIFFNASTRLSGMSLNAAFSLISSWSLRLSGVPVVHFVCQAGMSRCVLGTNRDDPHALPPCKECQAQSQAAFTASHHVGFNYLPDPAVQQMLEGLNVKDLSTVEVEGIPMGELVLPSMRWVLRRHHLIDDEPTRFLFRQYLQSAWNIAQRFAELLDEANPQAVVVFNGMLFPEATTRWVAKQRNIRVVSHEVGLQPFSGFFTTGDATAYPIDLPESFQLTPEQDAVLDKYLENRFQGRFTMAGVQFWPEMKSLSPEFLRQAANFRQIVPVFTNVIFDTSQGHANVLFPHMFAWLDQVLEIVKTHPETLFVLRAHPDESRPGKASRESVADWVKDHNAAQLPNLMFVDSGEFISSYELIQRAKFVMVYNSTIGLEASLLGAAVLCGGKARFTQVPTVFFPATSEEYRRLAEQFLAADRIEIPSEFRQNARRFLYTQLFRTSLPFDAFLEEDGFWKGYVRLKTLELRQLLPDNSPTLRVVVEGIRDDSPFLL